MKKILVLILSLATISVLTWFLIQKETPPQANLYPLIAGDTELKVELAESQGQRGQGLGDRKSLPQDQGMLFIFDKPDVYPFWMRDMQFTLDIIWIDENYKIVDIAKNVDPKTYPQSFLPKTPALYVLETNAGWTEKNKLTVGSQTIFLWKTLETIETKKDLIKVTKPEPLDFINKLGWRVAGQARGNWFFEASFPARLIDLKGNIIAQGPVQATTDNWMTTEFVPFDKEFYFDTEPATKYGLLILRKDNPSGLSEHDDKITIPVRFR